MKRLSLFILCVGLTTGAAYAQFGLGIKAGANFSNMKFEDISTDGRTGFHFGAFISVPLGSNAAIQPEVLYSTYGSEFSGGEDVNFSYLSIPILLKLDVSVLNLYVGPQLGILTNSDKTPVVPTEDQFKNTDWSAVLGVGIDLTKNFEVGGRYIYGVNDISDVPELGSVNNRLWQLYVALNLFGE